MIILKYSMLFYCFFNFYLNVIFGKKDFCKHFIVLITKRSKSIIMLKKTKTKDLLSNYKNEQTCGDGVLENFTKGFKKVTIDKPISVFNDSTVKNESENDDYGVMGLLLGDWYSYVEPDAKRVSNKINDATVINIASGVHTTIMPSPGMDSHKIPGKYSYVCEEYIEKLSFTKVPGGVRNRGGMNEQFCTAIKYEQAVRSANVVNGNIQLEDIHAENGMYLSMTDIYTHVATEKSIEEDRGVHRWDNPSGIKQLIENLYPTEPNFIEKENLISIINQYPYLDVVLYNVGSLDIPHYITKEQLDQREDKNYVAIMASKELRPENGILGPHFIPDYSISRSGVIPHGTTITLLGDMQSANDGLLHKGKPHFIHLKRPIRKILDDLGLPYNKVLDIFNPKSEDLLRNKLINVDEITLINIAAVIIDDDKKWYNNISVDDVIDMLKRLAAKANWEYKHMAFSKTMGRGISPTDKERPFPFEYPKLPFLPQDELNELNDKGEEEVYVQRMFHHSLYPYSVRPDIRLKNALQNQDVRNHIHIQLKSRQKTGSQGGIINIPFVDRFVPTTETRFNLYIETVYDEELGREILQLQYEQVIFFEFGFGDSGGTTSWPHIQVNTLRKIDDLNSYSKNLAEYGMNQHKNTLNKNGCPVDGDTLSRGDISKCPYHNNL